MPFDWKELRTKTNLETSVALVAINWYKTGASELMLNNAYVHSSDNSVLKAVWMYNKTTKLVKNTIPFFSHVQMLKHWLDLLWLYVWKAVPITSIGINRSIVGFVPWLKRTTDISFSDSISNCEQ